VWFCEGLETTTGDTIAVASGGDRTVAVGDTVSIRYCIAAPVSESTAVLTEVSPDTGRTWWPIHTSAGTDVGVEWIVPETLDDPSTGQTVALADTRCVFRVSVQVSEEPVSAFAVTEPPVEIRAAVEWWTCEGRLLDSTEKFDVLYPDGGEALRVGDTVTLRYCLTDEDMNFDLAGKEISVDGGKNWLSIPTKADGNYGWLWVVPGKILDIWTGDSVSLVSDQCLFKVSAYAGDGGELNSFAVSESRFSIVE
jgi:hypothetical protein